MSEKMQNVLLVFLAVSLTTFTSLGALGINPFEPSQQTQTCKHYEKC